MAGLSRAGFLRGRVSAPPKAVRPPWAPDGDHLFAAACDACGRCADACPEKIITTDRDRHPAIDFQAGACSFCGACADACPTGALDRRSERAPWRIVAAVGTACLSLRGTDCRICGEHCEPRAIRFRPLGGGRRLPDIDGALCTGCGACVAPCPVAAIAVRPFADAEKERAACG
ncbi:MAG TPA: ferredoxin-type protein NapF [Azospirillum sp.]